MADFTRETKKSKARGLRRSWRKEDEDEGERDPRLANGSGFNDKPAVHCELVQHGKNVP